jgi:hypothetical protein
VDILTKFFDSITLHSVLVGVGLFLITFVTSLVLVSIILVKIPSTYFKHDHPRELWAGRHPAIRLAGMIGKNLLGLVLVVVGIILSIPGVPGQGLLTVLLGIMLVDFPGKRQLERKLLERPSVLKTVNSLRHRFGKPELVLE